MLAKSLESKEFAFRHFSGRWRNGEDVTSYLAKGSPHRVEICPGRSSEARGQAIAALTLPGAIETEPLRMGPRKRNDGRRGMPSMASSIENAGTPARYAFDGDSTRPVQRSAVDLVNLGAVHNQRGEIQQGNAAGTMRQATFSRTASEG
jgi:hypothetical protein